GSRSWTSAVTRSGSGSRRRPGSRSSGANSRPRRTSRRTRARRAARGPIPSLRGSGGGGAAGWVGEDRAGTRNAPSPRDGPKVPVCRAPDDLLAPGGDDPLAADEERAVDPVKWERIEALQDVADLTAVERYVVRITIHECDLLGIHADLRLVAGHQGS